MGGSKRDVVTHGLMEAKTEGENLTQLNSFFRKIPTLKSHTVGISKHIVANKLVVI